MGIVDLCILFWLIDVQFSDGYWDLILIGNCPKLALLSLMHEMNNGNHVNSPHVLYLKVITILAFTTSAWLPRNITSFLYHITFYRWRLYFPQETISPLTSSKLYERCRTFFIFTKLPMNMWKREDEKVRNNGQNGKSDNARQLPLKK